MEKPGMQVIIIHPGVAQTAMGMKTYSARSNLGGNASWDGGITHFPYHV
jgi:hypothetical protein